MKKLINLAVAFAMVASVAVAGDHSHDHAAIDKKAPDFTLKGTDGKSYHLADFKGKYVVLEWTNPDCPFVKKHYDSDNMQALQKQWGEKEVVWLTICSSAPGLQGYYEAAEVNERNEDIGFAATAYLVDANGSVGHMYGAKTTPHMYVIDPSGVLIYAGAIDDKATTKQEDIDGATNYVTASLDASMAGKPVPEKATTPYGCSVKYKK